MNNTTTEPAKRSELAWMVLGLFAFGGASGFVAGMSEAPGISLTLLTSLFTFVGGALLSYTGFTRKAKDGSEARISPEKVGAGLLGFSFGIILGVIVGLWVHTHPPTALAGKGGWGLQLSNDEAVTCREIVMHAKQLNGFYATADGAKLAVNDIQWLADRVRCDVTTH